MYEEGKVLQNYIYLFELYNTNENINKRSFSYGKDTVGEKRMRQSYSHRKVLPS